MDSDVQRETLLRDPSGDEHVKRRAQFSKTGSARGQTLECVSRPKTSMYWLWLDTMRERRSERTGKSRITSDPSSMEGPRQDASHLKNTRTRSETTLTPLVGRRLRQTLRGCRAGTYATPLRGSRLTLDISAVAAREVSKLGQEKGSFVPRP